MIREFVHEAQRHTPVLDLKGEDAIHRSLSLSINRNERKSACKPGCLEFIDSVDSGTTNVNEKLTQHLRTCFEVPVVRS